MSSYGMPLAMVAAGELVAVTAISAGRGLQKRLADMGLTPGVQIRVMNSQMPGPVLIDLRGSRVALGRGIAHKIMVKKA
jgi:ferrous iron transport protein A